MLPASSKLLPIGPTRPSPWTWRRRPNPESSRGTLAIGVPRPPPSEIARGARDEPQAPRHQSTRSPNVEIPTPPFARRLVAGCRRPDRVTATSTASCRLPHDERRVAHTPSGPHASHGHRPRRHVGRRWQSGLTELAGRADQSRVGRCLMSQPITTPAMPAATSTTQTGASVSPIT